MHAVTTRVPVTALRSALAYAMQTSLPDIMGYDRDQGWEPQWGSKRKSLWRTKVADWTSGSWRWTRPRCSAVGT
jgi:hypothetical protein